LDRSAEILAEAEELLSGSGYEVVDVECVGGSNGLVVRVLVDKEGGVSVSDCSGVSRALGDHFEAKQTFAGRYMLEVSSPGVDRPVRKPEDFARFGGEKIKVSTFEKIDGRNRHQGVLVGFDTERDAVLVEIDGATCEIPLGSVRKARLIRDPWEGARNRS